MGWGGVGWGEGGGAGWGGVGWTRAPLDSGGEEYTREFAGGVALLSTLPETCGEPWDNTS